MNPILLSVIFIPAVEIYLFIKIGTQIGAITTILLIFSTAIIGIYYAKYEGFNTLRSGMTQMMRNELPLYEIVSGAALAFGALLLIIPGFATDFIGFLMIFPPTRKVILNKYFSNCFKIFENIFVEWRVNQFEHITKFLFYHSFFIGEINKTMFAS